MLTGYMSPQDFLSSYQNKGYEEGTRPNMIEMTLNGSGVCVIGRILEIRLSGCEDSSGRMRSNVEPMSVKNRINADYGKLWIIKQELF